MRRRGRYEGKEVLEDRNTGKESPKANEVKEANDKGEWKDGGGGVISSSLTPPPPPAPHGSPQNILLSLSDGTSLETHPPPGTWKRREKEDASRRRRCSL